MESIVTLIVLLVILRKLKVNSQKIDNLINKEPESQGYWKNGIYESFHSR